MPQSNTEATRALVQKFYDMVIAGDVDGLFEQCFAPDIVLEVGSFLPYNGAIIRGRDEFLNRMVPASAQLVDFESIKVDEIVADGDTGVAQVRVKILDSDDEVNLVEYWKVRDSRLAHVRAYALDPAPYLARMNRIARAQAATIDVGSAA